jgi:hypothetical protein
MLTLDYYTITKDKEGREVIIAKDMQGIIYTMVVLPAFLQKLAFVPTTQNATPKDNTQQGNTTKTLVITVSSFICACRCWCCWQAGS